MYDVYFKNYLYFLECSCNPAGAKQVPGYPLGGCGRYNDGRLCECKENVNGRICDTCKPGYWNLDRQNPLGCEGRELNFYIFLLYVVLESS